MRDFDTIVQMASDLQERQFAVLGYMREIKRHYEADYVVPLPDVKGEPMRRQYTPSLVTDTIDALGMRAASTHPVTSCPPTSMSNAANNRARNRRRALDATMYDQRWAIKRRRMYRHLCAYDTASLFIEPDFKNGKMMLNVRDPLFTFPEPAAGTQVRAPEYVAFITRESGSALRVKFPSVRSEQGGPITEVDGTEAWDVVEWVDTDQVVFGLMSPINPHGNHISESYQERFGTLAMQLGPAMINRAGRCLAVTPQEISLHSMGTRLNALLGNVEMQAKLMALEVMAQERAIFPDMFAIGQDNVTPRVVGGSWQDGRTGELNLLDGVRQVGQITQTPDVRTGAMIDRLEESFRKSSGLAPQLSGQAATVRTGRAMGQMMDMAVDPRIQELHEVTEAWLPWVNATMLSSYKGWFGSKTFSMYSGRRNDNEMVKFTPDNDVDSTENSVAYPIPGADIVQLTQILGSMRGAGQISDETFQELHPYVVDPESEHAQIVEESLFKALMAGLQEQIATGQLPLSAVAELYSNVRTGADLIDAFIKLDNEIRAQQAAAQQAAAQNMVPGLAAGPAAAAPGALPPEAAAPLASQGPQIDMAALLAGAQGGA